MATLGKPAIPTPNALDLRALQTAISNTRQRIEALEAQLGVTSSMAQTTSSTTTTNLNSILTQLSALAARIAVLESATTTDIATFIAAESISIGQCVVPIGPNNVGVADPNDTSRMFGVIGIAISNAASAGIGVQVQRRGVFAIPGATSFYAGHAAYVDTLGAVTQTPDYDATAIPIGLAVSGSQIFIAPDWPALLQPTFSSGIEDSFEAYLPVTYRAMLNALSLEAQISALPYSSGAEKDMMVPVVIGGVALRVSAGDIAALGGAGSGTVTSVALSSTGGTISITGTNPITGSGTINLEAVGGGSKVLSTLDLYRKNALIFMAAAVDGTTNAWQVGNSLGSARSCLGTKSFVSGTDLIQYEFSFGGGSDSNLFLGFGDASLDTASYPGADSHSWAFVASNGSTYHSGTNSAFISFTGVPGDVMGFCFDASGNCALYINGVSKGNMATGLTGTTLFAVYGTGSAGGANCTNFNPGTLKYPIAGYTALG